MLLCMCISELKVVAVVVESIVCHCEVRFASYRHLQSMCNNTLYGFGVNEVAGAQSQVSATSAHFIPVRNWDCRQ